MQRSGRAQFETIIACQKPKRTLIEKKSRPCWYFVHFQLEYVRIGLIMRWNDEIEGGESVKKDRDPLENVENVASMTECTGLMPVLPKDLEQDENYAELYAIHKAAKPCPKYRRK